VVLQALAKILYFLEAGLAGALAPSSRNYQGFVSMFRNKLLAGGVATLFVAAMVSGCTSTKTTNTARTAREQLLLSNAVDTSLGKVDLSSFAGQKVFIEEKYLDCVDKGYLIGSIRHRAMVSGATLVTKAEEADIVLELRAGALGTDSADAFLGTPEIALPGMLTVPEVRLVSRMRQSATAKIGLVAYDAKTNQLLGMGGVSSSMSDDNNWFVMGVGPYQSGTVKKELERTTIAAPGQYHTLPSTVAFSAPPAENAPVAETPGRLQLTSEEQPTTR
jgi:hypothetical protein